MGIGRQARQEIDHPVDHAPMTSMFNLADVFELVVDGFDQRAFAQ